MNRAVWFILPMIISFTILQGQEINRKCMDPRFEREVIVGACNREGLENDEEFGEPFKSGYSEYQSDEEIIQKLGALKEDYKILVVLGTWCDDSKEQVPHFYHILDDMQFDEKMLTIICVDGKKSCPDIDLEPFSIEFVPTFIFFRGGTELGRIVESPQMSLEEDMLNILE